MRARGFILLIIIASLAVGLARASPDLRNMTEIGSFTTTDPHDAEFYKDVLYIADGNSFLIYNTSDLERPRYAGAFTDIDYPGKVYGLSIWEDQLYLATGPGWIYVLNISNPERPKKLYRISYADSANDVAVSGNYMYVADSNNGMLIFDLSDRMNPKLISTFYVVKTNVSVSCQNYVYSPGAQCWSTTGWGGTSVAVSGNYAYLNGANREGFYIIDVSNPANPVQIYHSAALEAYNIAVSGNDVYLAHSDGTVSLNLLDVSNPYLPKVASQFVLQDTADKSAVAIHPPGDYIYAAAGETWHIFRAPLVQPATTPTPTPVPTTPTPAPTATPTPIQTTSPTPNVTPTTDGINIISNLVILAIIIYWFRSHKKKEP